MTISAIVIEDEDEQVRHINRILSAAGFDVTVFGSAEEARAGVRDVTRPVDLVVVDRRLPDRVTAEPVEEVGDQLLEGLMEELDDSLFVVFTAYADVPNVQRATRNRGQLTLVDGVVFDRVTHFQKTDYLEFEQHVTRVSAAISGLITVEIAGPALGHLSPVSRRLLRKVARKVGGVWIHVAPLAGGLTSSLVFDAVVRTTSGTPCARLVVKISDGRKPAVSGGFHQLLAARYVAAPGPLLCGMCDGWRADTFQIAGVEPGSIVSLMESDDDGAATATRQLMEAIDSAVSPVDAMRTLGQICESLISYDDLSAVVVELGLVPPLSSLMMSVRLAAQHGDLHPGNVLVVKGSPVLIDFDSECESSSLLDPVTMLLGMVFHATSPLRQAGWPAPGQASALGKDGFAVGCPLPEWCSVVEDWIREARSGDRELWALVLAFAARQLRFADVRNEPDLSRLAEALIRHALLVLGT